MFTEHCSISSELGAKNDSAHAVLHGGQRGFLGLWLDPLGGGGAEASNQRGMEGHNSFPKSVAPSFGAYMVSNFIFKLDVFNNNIATNIDKIFLVFFFFKKGTQIGSRSNPLFIKTAEEMEEYVSPYHRGIINKIYNVENSKDQQLRFLSK